ncbi:hypothetical protein [Nonomuraea sp. NPDC046570]|uniref:hypothetical protein n=1 Tax=Nonomuraea sp. NPDC046570 TaxID=3155255 RepID=UPI0033EA1D60
MRAFQLVGWQKPPELREAPMLAAMFAEQTGAASGMNANIRTIGGAIGAAVVGSIITASPQPSGLPYETGYTYGFPAPARMPPW